jgi:large subunit ribosomal protein L30e
MSDDEKEIETAEAEESADTEETVEATDAAPKEKKKKKVVRRRKTKKERENLLTVAIRLAVESGKVGFGARTGIAASILGKVKVFVLASNTPAEYRTKLQGYANTAKIPVIEFDGSTVDLGSVCGKPFPISILSVFEEGSSNIMEFVKK